MAKSLVPPIVFASCLALLCATAPARGGEVTVAYIERPPYYHTADDGTPAGLVMGIAQELFAEAGIPAGYTAMPPQRILHTMPLEPLCSVGWFRTPERERFARFTRPIYRDRPLAQVYTGANAERMDRHRTLRDVFRDGQLLWGNVSGFSYGGYVDALRDELDPPRTESSVSQNRLLGMLALGRFDYLLIAPEEMDAVYQYGLEAAGAPAADVHPRFDPPYRHKLGSYIVRSLEGMPHGNDRHIMCSKLVDPSTIRHLDAAIRAGAPVR